jgi:molybdate transport system regulatory protein
VVPPGATEVEVAVRSDAVVLRRPDGGGETSLRNELPGVVAAVDSGDSVAEVTVDLDGGPEIAALVTAESREALSLAPGVRTVASFKATAARGVGVE